MRELLERLIQQPEYHCLGADIEHGLTRARELGSDPFKVAAALPKLADERGEATPASARDCGRG